VVELSSSRGGVVGWGVRMSPGHRLVARIYGHGKRVLDIPRRQAGSSLTVAARIIGILPSPSSKLSAQVPTTTGFLEPHL